MKSHLRSLHRRLLTALLLVVILAAAGPAAAFEPAAAGQGPDQPAFRPAIARCDSSYAEGSTNGTVTFDLYREDTQIEVTTLAPDAVARPDPLQSNVGVGQTFVVNMYVQDVVGLYAADIHLSFDPAILQVQDANPGVPGVQIQPVASFFVPGFVIKQKACNAPDPGDPDCQQGGLAWYAAAQLNPSPPVTGSGPLAAITFTAVKAGVSPLTISYQQFSGSTGASIPSSHLDGTANVADVTMPYTVYLPVIIR